MLPALLEESATTPRASRVRERLGTRVGRRALRRIFAGPCGLRGWRAPGRGRGRGRVPGRDRERRLPGLAEPRRDIRPGPRGSQRRRRDDPRPRRHRLHPGRGVGPDRRRGRRRGLRGGGRRGHRHRGRGHPREPARRGGRPGPRGRARRPGRRERGGHGRQRGRRRDRRRDRRGGRAPVRGIRPLLGPLRAGGPGDPVAARSGSSSRATPASRTPWPTRRRPARSPAAAAPRPRRPTPSASARSSRTTPRSSSGGSPRSSRATTPSATASPPASRATPSR